MTLETLITIFTLNFIKYEVQMMNSSIKCIKILHVMALESDNEIINMFSIHVTVLDKNLSKIITYGQPPLN